MEIKRDALGRSYQLGALYDIRRDCFFDSLFKDKLPQSCVTSTDIFSQNQAIILETSYSDQFKTLNAAVGLKASVLAGLVEPGGSCKYLIDKKKSFRSTKVTATYKMTTKEEKINFNAESF